MSTKEPWSSTTRPERTGAGCGRLRLGAGLERADGDAAAILADALEHDLAVDQREQAVVTPLADALARHDVRPVLANDDGPGGDPLAAVRLHAQALRVGIAAVPGRTA